MEAKKESAGEKTQGRRGFEVGEDALGRAVYTFEAFSDSPFVVDAEYELEAIKGWGTYGLVASGKHLPTGQQIAVKRVCKVFNNLGDTKRILREIKILSTASPTENSCGTAASWA